MLKYVISKTKFEVGLCLSRQSIIYGPSYDTQPVITVQQQYDTCVLNVNMDTQRG